MTFAIAYPGEFSPAERRRIEGSFGIWLERIKASLEVGKEIIDSQNQAIFELCRKENLPVCDVAAAVPKDSRHFVDACHLTMEGNRLIAECLARALTPLMDAPAHFTSH